MSSNSRVMDATPQQVWEVLADGWLYPLWVVGASRMREVDDHWPRAGARLHHSVGSWPFLLDDETVVERCEPMRVLGLTARAWPSGQAGVEVRLQAQGTGTVVTIEEDASNGPGRLVPGPLRHALLGWRNVETLRRLAFLAERRQSPA